MALNTFPSIDQYIIDLQRSTVKLKVEVTNDFASKMNKYYKNNQLTQMNIYKEW
jgi:hypothetical protein